MSKKVKGWLCRDKRRPSAGGGDVWFWGIEPQGPYLHNGRWRTADEENRTTREWSVADFKAGFPHIRLPAKGRKKLVELEL